MGAMPHGNQWIPMAWKGVWANYRKGWMLWRQGAIPFWRILATHYDFPKP